MACNVTIQSASVTQVAAGAAVKIVISGTVRDCPKNPPNPQRPDEVWVDVAVSLLVNGQPDPAQTTAVTAVVTPPPAAGVAAQWSVEAKGLPPAPCGGQIRVRAACHTDGACVAEQDFTVDCGCPDVGFDVAVAPNCNADGTRTATFTITLTNPPPAGAPVFGSIHLGDGVAGSALLPVQFPGPQWTIQGNVATGLFPFDYLPGAYPNVSFETTFPTACAADTPLPATRLPLGIAACPRTDCPGAVTLVVRDATGNTVATGVNAPCLPAGDYTVVATAPSAAGRAFTWSVDGQIDGSPNVNGVNRNSYRRTIAAGSQTGISVAVATPGCDDVPTGGVELIACGQTAPPPPPPNPAPPFCEIARLGGLGLFIIGCVLIFAGMCSGNPVLVGVGLALAVAGIAVLALWAAFCAPFNGGCLLLQRLIEALELAAMLLPIVAAVLALFGIVPCSLGVIMDWGLVGTALAILNRIFRAVPCRFV